MWVNVFKIYYQNIDNTHQVLVHSWSVNIVVVGKDKLELKPNTLVTKDLLTNQAL